MEEVEREPARGEVESAARELVEDRNCCWGILEELVDRSDLVEEATLAESGDGR